MVFNSLTFVAFFAIVLAIYSLPFGWLPKKIVAVYDAGAAQRGWTELAALYGRALGGQEGKP